MSESIRSYLIELYNEHKEISWTHPRTLLLLAVLTKTLKYKNFTEVGTWLGAVPIMIKKLEYYFDSDQLKDFVLIENFKDHIANKIKISDSLALQNHINKYIPNVNINVYTDVSQINSTIDVIHFDSVKYQRDLINQFDSLKNYFTPNTLYIFDDYIAEWPDVIYCVDTIANYRNLSRVASFGPKVYLCTPQLKDYILRLISSNEELKTYMDIRNTLKYGDVIGSDGNLNL